VNARAGILAALLLSAGGLFTSSCTGFQHNTFFPSQRWPEPMETAKPLPPGDATLYPPGPEEVRVIRHADPVQVRAAGNAGAVPLSFHRKEMRVASGSGVSCSEEGRVEVLFDSGSSVVLYGQCNAIIGSPSRGEPSLFIRDLEQVRFEPVAEDLYELSGGTRLRARAGPIRASLARKDVIRIANESKRSAQVAFLQETIVLDPGQAVFVPILSTGSRPPEATSALADAAAPGFHAAHAKTIEVTTDGSALVARGEGEVRSLGVRVKLPAGAEARFVGLGARTPNAAGPNGAGPNSGGEAR
jgi:hypothetical protein